MIFNNSNYIKTSTTQASTKILIWDHNLMNFFSTNYPFLEGGFTKT